MENRAIYVRPLIFSWLSYIATYFYMLLTNQPLGDLVYRMEYLLMGYVV